MLVSLLKGMIAAVALTSRVMIELLRMVLIGVVSALQAMVVMQRGN